MATDWLVNRPPHGLSPRQAATWLVFPLAWPPFTMIRGARVDWYPYPFIDPREKTTAEIAIAVVAILAIALAIGEGLRRWAGRSAPAR